MLRNIITIDENKCNGCGQCIPGCPEGALKIIDGKARLVSDLFCDGLGACIGQCPMNAITIEKREAKEYDEQKVMENIVKGGKSLINEHLMHLKSYDEQEYYSQAIEYLNKNNVNVPKISTPQSEPCACPGPLVKEIKALNNNDDRQQSKLSQWPIQLHLIPVNAPFFNNSNLLIAADCVGFANPDLHDGLLKENSIAIGCPKLDDDEFYLNKIKSIIESNTINRITVAIMEVPCCNGLYSIAKEALIRSGKDISLKKIIIGVDGKII